MLSEEEVGRYIAGQTRKGLAVNCADIARNFRVHPFDVQPLLQKLHQKGLLERRWKGKFYYTLKLALVPQV